MFKLLKCSIFYVAQTSKMLNLLSNLPYYYNFVNCKINDLDMYK